MPRTGNNQNFFTIGHRGAAGEKFENSMSGFRHALGLNIDAIELDIRAHNGELWVIHDLELKRLTGKPGLFHDLVNPGSVLLKNKESIPKLRDVLDLYWGKMPINIEIKSINTTSLLTDLLDQYPVPGPNAGLPWIIISSFDHRLILELRQRGCPWPLAPVTFGIPMQPISLIETLQPYSWHMDYEYLDFDLIEQLQNSNIRVMVYTVNDQTIAQDLRDKGIDGIFTDYPSKMRLID